MTVRSKVGLAGAVLLNVINLVGGFMAVARGEMMHTGIHAALLLPGAYLMWRLAPRLFGPGMSPQDESATASQTAELTNLLTQLELSVDAVAIEVERIGEGQRFMARFLSERGQQATHDP